MFGLGTTELIIIAVIIFVLFGARRLPEVGRGLGQAIKEFKKVKKEVTDETGQIQASTNSTQSQPKEEPSKQ